jgi:transcriptional regulator with XRE-family HTH domain
MAAPRRHVNNIHRNACERVRGRVSSTLPHEHNSLGRGNGRRYFSGCVRQPQNERRSRDSPHPLFEPPRHRESTVADRTSRGKLVRSNAYSFGRRLKDQREHHGVTLEAIAAATKISASFFAGLERGDVSAWPNGIFRRAFVREYATAIGVSPESTLAEFARVFPEPGTSAAADGPEAARELRLTMAIDGRATTIAALRRVVTVLIEVGLIVAASLAIASAAGSDIWRICATIALIYYPLAMIVQGRHGALSDIQRGFGALKKPARQRSALAETPATEHGSAYESFSTRAIHALDIGSLRSEQAVHVPD